MTNAKATRPEVVVPMTTEEETRPAGGTPPWAVRWCPCATWTRSTVTAPWP
ncbi:hypothetical protein HML84_10535 [Alcanivorax sp. IO_7]|nr:hypothetical protein HML84_10535 [Alcanivorax sp. IO_7]